MIPIKIHLTTEEETLTYRGFLKEKIDMRILEYSDENMDNVQICIEKNFITITRKASRMLFKENYMDEFQYRTEYGDIFMKLLTNKIENKNNSFLIDYFIFDEEDNLIFKNKMKIEYIKEQ